MKSAALRSSQIFAGVRSNFFVLSRDGTVSIIIYFISVTAYNQLSPHIGAGK